MMHRHRPAPVREAAAQRIAEGGIGRARRHRAVGELVAAHVVEQQPLRLVRRALGHRALGFGMVEPRHPPAGKARQHRLERFGLERMPAGQDQQVPFVPGHQSASFRIILP